METPWHQPLRSHLYETAGSRMGFPGGSDVKESLYSAGGESSIPGSGRFPGGRHGNPLQYSCLENPMERGVWRAAVHGVAKSGTQLSSYHGSRMRLGSVAADAGKVSVGFLSSRFLGRV